MAEEPTFEELIEGLRNLQVQVAQATEQIAQRVSERNKQARRKERARARAQHVGGNRLPNNRLPIGHRVCITNGVRLVGEPPTGVIRWH